MSEGVDDDDFDVAPGGASSSQAVPVAFGGGPLAPPLPRFGSAAVATRQVFLAREQSPPTSLQESDRLCADFRMRQREASAVRRPRSPDHPPPPPTRPAHVPPAAAAPKPPPADVPPANVRPAAAPHRVAQITDIDDRAHDVPAGRDPIMRLGLAYC